VNLDSRVLLGSPWKAWALFMSINLQDRVEEHRAAVLLGVPTMELRRYSRVSGLGHLENGDHGEEMVFTYEELRRLCLLAAQSSK
jgi:hypothetical protein